MKENFPIDLALALFRVAHYLDAVTYEEEADEIIQPAMDLYEEILGFLEFIGFNEEDYYGHDTIESDLLETGRPVTVVMGEQLKPEYYPNALQFARLLFVRGLGWDEGQKIDDCMKDCLISQLSPGKGS